MLHLLVRKRTCFLPCKMAFPHTLIMVLGFSKNIFLFLSLVRSIALRRKTVLIFVLVAWFLFLELKVMQELFIITSVESFEFTVH